MAAIYGTEFDDFITGTSAADTIVTFEGDDIVNGGNGSDTISGGGGNDLISGDLGADIVNGGDGDDVIDDSNDFFDANTLNGDDGNDTIVAGQGNDILSGGIGNDLLAGAYGNDNLSGGDGDDVLNGGFGRDVMSGGAGNDTYYVDSFDFISVPGSATDPVIELPGQGIDTIFAFDIDFVALESSSFGASLVNVENVTVLGMGAAQVIGNALANRFVGNDAPNIFDGKAGADILEGRGGNDTYQNVEAQDTIVEAASGGVDTVTTSISYVLPANFENLTLLSAAAVNGRGNELNNRVTGNVAANFLFGLDGNDTLNGAGGADRLYGGLGNDIMFVDDAGDLAIEAVNQGTDWVYSTISYTLAGYVENLRLLSGPAALTATGNSLANVILGNEAANTLDGKAGADDMRGGAGDDLYIVDNALDTVTETAAGGVDQINSSVSMVLGANVENLTLTGSAAINGTGNAATNVLNGNAASNRLDGQGGADVMAGGLGNDVYTIDDLFDLVTEFANEGVDQIESATTGVNLAFVGFANVENAALTGALSNNLTGSASANVLTGNAGNNAIDGKGGADTMRGGLGNDVYTVDDAGDIVAELAGQGVDKVVSSLAYTLGLNVENLDLSGALAIDGTGNTLANVLTGNSAANRLDGGVGADTMAGGGGNDTYVVDNAGDVVTEIAAQGTDRVEARVTYTLTAEVEDLTLTGAAAIAGTGNALANLIVGNAAGNTIDGLLGADTLTGGLGKDIFVFSQVNAVDTLTDFTPIDDTMRLSNAAFGFALTPGVAVKLVANATPVSAAAVPTFLYDTDNGRLSVDLDGTGLGFSPVLFAILTGAPVITVADFQVVA